MSSSRYIKHDDLMLSNNNKYNKKITKKERMTATNKAFYIKNK